jgi:cytosine/adenosine deaminase-related metal-dependent hydrolase
MAGGLMRRAFVATASLMLGTLAACAQPRAGSTEPGASTPTSANGIIAFVGVDVLPMDRDALLRDRTVIVRDGRIATIAPAAEVDLAPGTFRIDGTGKVLVPGLTEMHGHVPGPDDPQYAQDVLFLYLANGVTTVRNMAGHPWHLDLRRRVDGGEVAGPNLIAASPWLSAKTAEEAERKVREAKQAGFDLAKIGDMPRAAYAAMANTAHALGLPFAGHVPFEVGLAGALDAKQASIDHLDRYVEFLVPPGVDTTGRDPGVFGSGWIGSVDRSRIDDAVQRTLAAGTWNVPTLSFIEHLASPEPAETMIRRPEFRYLPREVREAWVRAKHEYAQREDFSPEAARSLVRLRRELLKALHDGGAPVALGSDAPQFFNVPGFSVHHEMRMMVDAGLTPYEVLTTGTRNPARAVGTPDAFGTVAVGRRADLVLLEADPRADIANAARRVGVMVRGQWWPEARLQSRLQEIAARRAD